MFHLTNLKAGTHPVNAHYHIILDRHQVDSGDGDFFSRELIVFKAIQIWYDLQALRHYIKYPVLPQLLKKHSATQSHALSPHYACHVLETFNFPALHKLTLHQFIIQYICRLVLIQQLSILLSHQLRHIQGILIIDELGHSALIMTCHGSVHQYFIVDCDTFHLSSYAKGSMIVHVELASGMVHIAIFTKSKPQVTGVSWVTTHSLPVIARWQLLHDGHIGAGFINVAQVSNSPWALDTRGQFQHQLIPSSTPDPIISGSDLSTLLGTFVVCLGYQNKYAPMGPSTHADLGPSIKYLQEICAETRYCHLASLGTIDIARSPTQMRIALRRCIDIQQARDPCMTIRCITVQGSICITSYHTENCPETMYRRPVGREMTEILEPVTWQYSYQTQFLHWRVDVSWIYHGQHIAALMFLPQIMIKTWADCFKVQTRFLPLNMEKVMNFDSKCLTGAGSKNSKLDTNGAKFVVNPDTKRRLKSETAQAWSCIFEEFVNFSLGQRTDFLWAELHITSKVTRLLKSSDLTPNFWRFMAEAVIKTYVHLGMKGFQRVCMYEFMDKQPFKETYLRESRPYPSGHIERYQNSQLDSLSRAPYMWAMYIVSRACTLQDHIVVLILMQKAHHLYKFGVCLKKDALLCTGSWVESKHIETHLLKENKPIQACTGALLILASSSR
ncbi:hypothetical protein IW262DRAFT_1302733 [Armillaria fumosa]|nr:hypothetical protein IW262DRAFT_1302733 [Armillaria fumosa]